MNVNEIKKKIEQANEKGGLTVDERIELIDALTSEQDAIAELFQSVTEIADLEEPEEGRKNRRDAFVDGLIEDSEKNDREAIRKKYSLKELKALAKEFGLKGYSSMSESDLIDLLLNAGIEL